MGGGISKARVPPLCSLISLPRGFLRIPYCAAPFVIWQEGEGQSISCSFSSASLTKIAEAVTVVKTEKKNCREAFLLPVCVWKEEDFLQSAGP